MSGDEIVRVEGLGKKFSRNLSRSIRYGISDIARDFFGLKPPAELRPQEFYALQDVSFSLSAGECLGVIGPNGAGKSSLLKLLNGIILPDAGSIRIRKKVAALIELGAGFHPLLTGRENIFVNGAILGLSRADIKSHLDAIIEFSGLGDFIDTPVKYYSSGMYVRLGFAVAAQLEPDVLLIDEILAVGDISFRARCYNRIAELQKRAAIIFVSHNMPIVSRMCTRCLVLDHGKVAFSGNNHLAVQTYLQLSPAPASNVEENVISLREMTIDAPRKDETFQVTFGGRLSFSFALHSDQPWPDVSIGLHINSFSGEAVAEWNSRLAGLSIDLAAGVNAFNLEFKNLRLNPGSYQISLIVSPPGSIKHLLWIHYGWKLSVTGFQIGSANYQIEGQLGRTAGP